VATKGEEGSARPPPTRFGFPLFFCGLCVFLDEISTFSILALGGRELNPRLSRIIKIHPLLWTLMDVVLLLCLAAVGRMIKIRGSSLPLLGVGAGRLLYFLWNATQIMHWHGGN